MGAIICVHWIYSEVNAIDKWTNMLMRQEEGSRTLEEEWSYLI